MRTRRGGVVFALASVAAVALLSACSPGQATPNPVERCSNLEKELIDARKPAPKLELTLAGNVTPTTAAPDVSEAIDQQWPNAAPDQTFTVCIFYPKRDDTKPTGGLCPDGTIAAHGRVEYVIYQAGQSIKIELKPCN